MRVKGLTKKSPNFAVFPFISFSAKIAMKNHITVEPNLKLTPFQALAVHLSHNRSLPVCISWECLRNSKWAAVHLKITTHTKCLKIRVAKIDH